MAVRTAVVKIPTDIYCTSLAKPRCLWPHRPHLFQVTHGTALVSTFPKAALQTCCLSLGMNTSPHNTVWFSMQPHGCVYLCLFWWHVSILFESGKVSGVFISILLLVCLSQQNYATTNRTNFRKLAVRVQHGSRNPLLFYPFNTVKKLHLFSHWPLWRSTLRPLF